MGNVLFSQVCLSTPGGGRGGRGSTPSPCHNTSTGHMPPLTELDGGTPSFLSGQDGGNPPPPWETEQQSEYLLRGGPYASCIQAGGLSCYLDNIMNAMDAGMSLTIVMFIMVGEHTDVFF